MKFVHIADMHFDSPFVKLSDKDVLGDLRRLDQRKALKKVIEYIKQNDIKYLFISGDLYEHKYVKRSTIEYINKLFEEIPETKIFIAPGNHDPITKNSYYNKFNWSENVKIFGSKIEKVETEDANIYGYGFDDFYCENSGIENIEVENNGKLNILVIHGTVDGANIEEKQYNSMSKKLLEQKGFDYVALGHIHKPDYNTQESQRIVYPGSTISLGFDELGKHGMVVGDLNKQEIKLEFIPVDDKEFKIKEIVVDDILSNEDLIEKIDNMQIPENEYVEVVLKGNRNFEINIYNILKCITNTYVIKIKDETKLSYDIEKLKNETTLKGLYVKEMCKLLDEAKTEEEKALIEKAIEIGLESLK